MYAVEVLTVSNIFKGLNIMVFSFTSQFMLVEIISEMKDPKEFPKAYALLSAPFQGITFLICGLGGYYFRGHLVDGMIIDNIPFGMWFRVTAGCLIIHMLITWVIKGIVLCRAVHSWVSPKGHDDQSMRGWYQWGGIVTIALGLSYFVAQIVPFFVDLVDLIGASLSPVVCFIIPIILYLRRLWDSGKEEDRIGYVEGTIIFLEMMLALTMLFVGTYLAVTNIRQSWHTYGYPFACHCQGLWNTCDCSASHPGMEHCAAGSSL